MNNLLEKHKQHLGAGIFVGLLSYLYMMTNKLPNWDEAVSMFSKGTTISSGRWVLEYMDILFPNFSLPWLWGFVSIVIVSLSACVTIEIFKITEKYLQCAIAGLMVFFPALISSYAYMFTVEAYAIGLLLAVMTVYTAASLRKKGVRIIVPVVLLVLSLGIYQAYLPIVVSYFLILVLQKALNIKPEDIKTVLFDGIRYVFIIIVGGLLYFVITKRVLILFDTQFNSIASDAMGWQDLLYNIGNAYKYFACFFLKRSFSLIAPGLSQAIHLVCGGLTIALLLKSCIRIGNTKVNAIIILLIGLFPLAVNSLFIVIKPKYLGTMESYGFFAVYVLAAVLMEANSSKTAAHEWVRKIMVASMVLVITVNVYTANRCWLQMEFAYENMKATYSTIITQVNMMPGFDENSKIVFVGELPDNQSLEPFFDEPELEGIPYSLLNIYSREYFLKRYLNCNIPMGSIDEVQDEEILKGIQDMNCYPYYGYISMRNHLIIVKLGEMMQ